MMHDDKWDNHKWYFPAPISINFLPVVHHNRKHIFHIHVLILGSIFFRQITAGATAPVTPMNTSPFLTVAEAEKQTASSVVGVEQGGQKTRNQLRTPGKVYNWDG